MPTRPSQGDPGPWGTKLNAWLDANIPYVDSRNYLVGDGTTDDTAAFGTWLSAVKAAQVPGFFAGGSSGSNCKITAALDWTGDNLKIIGAGSDLVKITQATANTPIITVGGAHQKIGGMTLAYSSQQTYTQTGATALAIGKNGVSANQCIYTDFRINYSNTAVYLNQGLNVAGLFSSVFHSFNIDGYSLSAMVLDSRTNSAGCTGCFFENIYTHNDISGSPAAAHGPVVMMGGWSEIEFDQLNIEHAIIGSDHALKLASAGNVVINGLHFEDLEFSTDNVGAILVSDDSRLFVNAMSSTFNTFDSGTTKQFAKLDFQSKLVINGFAFANNTVNVTAHPLIQFAGTVTDSDVWIQGGDLSQVAAEFTLPYATGTSSLARFWSMNAPMLPANNQTGTTYTLALTDMGLIVELNNVSAVTLTVPPESSVKFPIGATVQLFQQGAGQVHISPGSGVTIRAPSSKAHLTGQYSTATLRKRASDEWSLEGDLTT